MHTIAHIVFVYFNESPQMFRVVVVSCHFFLVVISCVFLLSDIKVFAPSPKVLEGDVPKGV